MAYAILGNPKPAFFDSSGSPLVSGTITTQDPADDSVKASYPTAADADAGTNGTSGDITLDSRGEPTSTQYWGRDGEDYKVIIKDSAAATVYTLTNIRLPGKERRATVTFTNADATPTIAEGTHFITNGSTAITDFDDGQVGDVIHVACGGTAITLTQNVSLMQLDGGTNFNMRNLDSITLGMFEDQVWKEIGRSVGSVDYEVVTETNVITAAETGKTFFLNSATEFTSTLPTAALGLNYKFIISAAPSGANYVVTAGSAIIKGGINELEINTGNDGPYSAGATNVNFIGSASVASDWCEVVCDGTNWFLTGQSNADGGITLT